MSKIKVKYEESDVFCFPLTDGSYSLGLIARKHRDSLLGYFFNCKYNTTPNIAQVQATNDNVIYVGIFSALGIKNGEWTILGKLPNWDRNQWPIPPFKHKDVLIPDYYEARFYDEKLQHLSSKRITAEEAAALPEDGLAGYGYIERVISKLISKESH